MGLIMLILIGCAPTAYALNRTMPQSATPAFIASANAAADAFAAHYDAPTGNVVAARAVLTDALRSGKADSAETFGAVEILSRDVSARIGGFGSLGKVPAAATPNLRNDMYLVLDTTRLVTKDKDATKDFSAAEMKAIGDYQAQLEQGTRYIPLWVKISVALALGLGTMVGWKRIVVTVGERIGKTHLTYGMGASAELMAAGTILLAQNYGLPVSTTHILTSGVAGASVANGTGLRARTVTSMALAWVMTLPAAMLLSGGLYWLLLGLLDAFGAR
jgi:PiT family inorganic phosphate transporter